MSDTQRMFPDFRNEYEAVESLLLNGPLVDRYGPDASLHTSPEVGNNPLDLGNLSIGVCPISTFCPQSAPCPGSAIGACPPQSEGEFCHSGGGLCDSDICQSQNACEQDGDDGRDGGDGEEDGGEEDGGDDGDDGGGDGEGGGEGESI